MKAARRPARRLVVICCAAVTPLGAAAAQSPTAQPQDYLLTTEAADARAIWVQPAGLQARREASLGALLGWRRTPDGNDLAQYGLLLASRGLGLGWQHDRGPDGASGNVWAVGFAVGGPARALGITRRWFRGTNTRDAAVDIGARVAPRPGLLLSATWRNVGSPVLRDTTAQETFTPGVLFSGRNGLLRLGADWEMETRDWSTRGVRLGATAALPRGFAVSARADFTDALHYNGIAVALTWNGRVRRTTASAAWPTDGTDRYGLMAAAVRPLESPRRFR